MYRNETIKNRSVLYFIFDEKKKIPHSSDAVRACLVFFRFSISSRLLFEFAAK